MIESEVSAAEWKLELEQVSSQLVVRLNVDHKDWRTHIESMGDQEKTIKELLPSTTEELERIADDIFKVNDRIQKREAMLSSDGAIGMLLSNYKKNQDEVKSVNDRFKMTEKSISELSSELQKTTSELDDMKNAMKVMNNNSKDVTPLQEIKESLHRIRGELRQMDLRTGVLQHTLLQHKIKTSRAMSAKGQKNAHNHKHRKHTGYEFDPFNVNNPEHD
ncbi:hypothetical protein AKO1_009642 [Acrasis kona]|uniref:Uncharacterized protein n=1 Tax=Acrasis kona TaxID=1008807 RepID=A0AAW2ZMU2_9EUKA